MIAQREDSVSVLFCDIVNFSELVQQHKNAANLVAILNSVYSTFDHLCTKNGVRKMETVGKTYMACAGLLGSRKDHAFAVVELGEEMMALMAKCTDRKGDPLLIRIGINTGPVYSGIVGMKRPQFSLFGDTVNTASRMQSTGIEGRIQVSQATYVMLCKDYRFYSRFVFPFPPCRG